MNLQDIKTTQILTLVRGRITKYVPNHGVLNYEELFKTCRSRALHLWNTRIAPELDIQEQRVFERALVDVGIRAGLSIPWTFASGYVFGMVCHTAAGGDLTRREEAAVICGLMMFFMGTYDHLLDEHPEEFLGIEKLINAESIENWAKGNNLDSLKVSSNKVLANGLLKLYQTYFKLCVRLFNRSPDSKLLHTWVQVLRDIHRVEAESFERRISKITPNEELIKHTEEPSIVAFWALAVTACLAEGEDAARIIEKFAKGYGRLTWYADDASDIEKDIGDDRWSGLAIRLALDAKDNRDIESIALNLADEAGRIVTMLYEVAGNMYWHPDDKFTLADILWAYIWAWLGGSYEQSADQEPSQQVAI